MRALVIADDFTGAAEIAASGHRCGLPTRVLRRVPSSAGPGLTVLDTDSRLLAPEVATNTVSKLLEPLLDEPFDLVFKKTDSVLRGPVAAEVEAIAAALGRSSVLLVPQNPSRGRVIVDGEYRIDGVPLHRTSFADDPTHPRRTSVAGRLLDAHATPITIGDGASAADLDGWASRLTPETLPAGGADFFTALLARGGFHAVRLSLEQLPPGPRLFVVGSTQPYPLIPTAPARPMMDSSDAWADALCRVLGAGSDAMMTVDRPLQRDAGAAAEIEGRIATVAATVLRRCAVGTVFVTGGATAAAVCHALEWFDFDVEGELAPGVVQLRPHGVARTSLIVKPGSYPWPQQLHTI